ncbi:hypothetical protein [Novosphingobium resinovorum]|uniref:terminase small subunit-like protein n=1 Tax=Novosphingobium resinovorum TaxID=158500 RepID=UPI000A8BF5B7|nr:hypothetical protein [Novosphingobium resinovorum]
MDTTFREDVIEELLEKLAEGQGLATICRDPRMPSRQCVYKWMRTDESLAERIADAREAGYQYLGEKTLRDVEECADPIKARLIFEARRWYLGKLSQAFAEKPVAIGAFVNVDAGDAFAAVAGALDRAAEGIASRGTSTQRVVAESEAGPGDAPGRLAHLDGPGGAGLGENPNGG